MSATEGARWAAEEFPFTVSAQLRTARQRLGWTLAEAGERLPTTMSASTLHRIETCQRPLRLKSLWEISTTLGLGVVTVITDAVQATASPSPCLACQGSGVEPAEVERGEHPTVAPTGHRQTTGEGR